MAFMAGSSLAGDGIAWTRVSAQLNQPIGGWGVAGASPVEMEGFQHRMPEATTTFIVISAYDMNEGILSDFRADVVPPRHAIKELMASRAPWPYSKRVMSQYLVCGLRKLFPTIGRSQGLLGELRSKISGFLEEGFTELEEGPTLTLGEPTAEKAYKYARISSWSQGMIIRKLQSIRGGFLGEHNFGGLKHRALQRMVKLASQSGKVYVVVLPVSPIYAQAFLTPPVLQKFENSLAKVQSIVPNSRWVRIDELSGLTSNDHFWDLVHMNATGQRIATNALLTRVKELNRLR